MREPHKSLGAANAGVPHDPRDLDAAHTPDREKHLFERVPAFVSRPFWCPPQHQRVSISSPESTRSTLLARCCYASFGGISWSCGGCHTSPWRTTCPCGSWRSPLLLRHRAPPPSSAASVGGSGQPGPSLCWPWC